MEDKRTVDNKAVMIPRTVGAEYEVSRRMLLQSSEVLGPILRRDLGVLLAQSLDADAIRAGGPNEHISPTRGGAPN